MFKINVNENVFVDIGIIILVGSEVNCISYTYLYGTLCHMYNTILYILTIFYIVDLCDYIHDLVLFVFNKLWAS